MQQGPIQTSHFINQMTVFFNQDILQIQQIPLQLDVRPNITIKIPFLINSYIYTEYVVPTLMRSFGHPEPSTLRDP